MKTYIKKPGYFWSGIIIIIIFIISYFIKFRVDSGSNFDIYDSLLGLIIFHNPFILAIYVLIIVMIIKMGLGKK